MVNHPNRGRNPYIPGRSPKMAEIIAVREALGLTQTEAAKVIYCGLRTWQRWETEDRSMHPAYWELFWRKAGKPEIPQAALSRAAGVEEDIL